MGLHEMTLREKTVTLCLCCQLSCFPRSNEARMTEAGSGEQTYSLFLCPSWHHHAHTSQLCKASVRIIFEAWSTWEKTELSGWY